MAQKPENQTKKSNRKELEITPEIQEYWSERDIDPTSEFYIRAAKEARRRYYAKQILKSLDPDKTAKLNDMLSGDVKSRNKIADKFAKENPNFYVPTEKFVDILGSEDAVNDYLQLAKEYEESRGISTEGQGPEAYGFGSRAAATIFGGYRATRIDSAGKRSYDIDYDPEKGYINQMVNIEMDPNSKDFKYMSEVLKEDKPELSNGIDTIQRPRSDAMKGMKFNTIEEAKAYYDSLYLGSNSTLMHKELPDQFDIKINHPELKATATTPVESKGIKMDSAAISGIGNIAGETIDTLDSKDNGKTSVGGAIAKGAGAGAAVGLSIGGPWGAAIGGVIGGAAGGISSAINNKKIDKKLEEELQKNQLIEATKGIQLSQNTQSPIYEEGTYAASMTQPVEVERDELVLRKNSLGKYRVVADFKGGKTHSQGGEDYVLKEGDVVFPGKKRKTIMNHLKTNNHSGIESERMKLPKDLPDTGKLQKGIRDKTDPNIDIEPWMLNGNFNERQDQDTKLEPWMMKSWIMEDNTPTNAITKTPTNAITSKPSIPTPETRQKGISGPSNVLSGIGDYAPSITNIIRGLQKPETETRRFLTPETLRYRDASELLRKESDIQSRVDMENAARFSGGSGQIARAGKSLAGASKFKRSQAISEGEAQRAQGIEAQNIAIRNQASANNLQLANQYDALDAQNKAAVDAYFNQGIYDVGRISHQRKMDKKAGSLQSLMLKMLEERNFRYDEDGNLVEFKR